MQTLPLNLSSNQDEKELTHKEVSTCPQKNWEFWSECAKLSLSWYRKHKREHGKDYAFTKSYKVDFKDRLQKRREQVHLIKSCSE